MVACGVAFELRGTGSGLGSRTERSRKVVGAVDRTYGRSRGGRKFELEGGGGRSGVRLAQFQKYVTFVSMVIIPLRLISH